jgi:hypothetical protein
MVIVCFHQELPKLCKRRGHRIISADKNSIAPGLSISIFYTHKLLYHFLLMLSDATREHPPYQKLPQCRQIVRSVILVSMQWSHLSYRKIPKRKRCQECSA